MSESKHDSRAFSVPVIKGVWFTEREPGQIRQMIRDQIDTEQYEQSLVFIISKVEDFISSLIRVILTAHPEKLARGPNEGKSNNTVEVREIVAAKDLESILRKQIEVRIERVMREPASTFLYYLAAILGASLKTKKTNKNSGLRDAIEKYCEISATRDMIVHTGRMATPDYERKAERHSRVKVGEVLPVDEQYFRKSIAHIKDLYEHFEEAMIADLKGNGKIA